MMRDGLPGFARLQREWGESPPNPGVLQQPGHTHETGGPERRGKSRGATISNLRKLARQFVESAKPNRLDELKPKPIKLALQVAAVDGSHIVKPGRHQ